MGTTDGGVRPGDCDRGPPPRAWGQRIWRSAERFSYPAHPHEHGDNGGKGGGGGSGHGPPPRAWGQLDLD